jgi:outer membrane lipoprotein-sorting protein
MNSAEKIKKLFAKSDVTVDSKVDDRIINDALTAIDKFEKTEPVSAEPNIWRMITKNRITKLAAAAVIIVLVSLGIFLMNKSLPSAYALEQTLKALQSIATVHVIGTDWDSNRYEAWNKINPETGKAEWVCIDQTPHGNKIASTPKGSCVWDKDGNVVRLTNRIIATNDSRYAYIFEDLSSRMSNPSSDEKITIYREKDEISAKEVIVIWVVTKMKDYKVYVDPANKLPIRMHFVRADNMPQICKTVDHIFYNVELPQGMFDFEIPDEFIKDRSALDDPNKGISAEGLSQEKASALIAEKYWKAAITRDWDTFRRLAPVDESWKTGFRKNPPVELIEVKQPYPERGCTGLIVPCIVRFKDGKVKESKAVVNYREINGKRSCIIVARWGKPRLIE